MSADQLKSQLCLPATKSLTLAAHSNHLGALAATEAPGLLWDLDLIGLGWAWARFQTSPGDSDV